MWIAIWIVSGLALLALAIAIVYVSATYLLLAYDRRLARHGIVHPSYDDPNHFPRGWTRWRGIACEILSVFIVCWIYPIGMLSSRARSRPRGGGVGRPILCIHGYNHNRSGFFLLSHRIARTGLGPVYSINLPLGNRSLEEYASVIEQQVKRIEKDTGVAELVLIGHSMGGVLAALYAETKAPPGKVSHVITLASPLHGTRLAVIGNKQAANQMAVNSETIREIARAVASNHSIQYHHMATRFDSIIYPYQSALMGKRPGNECILPDIGHMTLLFSRRTATQIINWLRGTVPVAPPKPGKKKWRHYLLHNTT